jgi:hypothetical protein
LISLVVSLPPQSEPPEQLGHLEAQQELPEQQVNQAQLVLAQVEQLGLQAQLEQAD